MGNLREVEWDFFWSELQHEVPSLPKETQSPTVSVLLVPYVSFFFCVHTPKPTC